MPPAKSRPVVKPTLPKKPAPEVVDPTWLLKALGICVAAALICAYVTLCLLFYQGSWQLILHPSHVVDRTPAQAGLEFSSIRFDASETGQPRLTGWWIPAASAPGLQPRYDGLTILFLHDGSGSLSSTIPALARLHTAGLNVFAFDYRGFGASDSAAHPSFESMSQDTSAAFRYLTETQHIAGNAIVPYGVGLGASLAAGLAESHTEFRAVIVDNPDPDPQATAYAQRPSHIVPVKWIFGKQFDIAGPISMLKTPKLLIAGGPNAPTPPRDSVRLQGLFQKAASPRFSIAFPSGSADAQYQDGLKRFLDQIPTSR